MQVRKDGDRYSPTIREEKKMVQLPKEIRGKLHPENKEDKRLFWKRDKNR